MSSDEQYKLELERCKYELERYKYELERYKCELEKYKINSELWKSGIESAVNFAGIALRSMLLLNGGAALAFLAIIARIYSSGSPVQMDIPKDLTPALIYFGWGAFLSPLTAFLAYAAQFHYSHANAAEEPEKNPQYKYGRIYHFLAVIAALSGLILFIVGMYSAADVFSLRPEM